MKTIVALVGTKYRGPKAVKLLASLPNGEALTLKRDPNNQYDRNCVEVWARGVLIGFVPKTQNRDLAMAMDSRARGLPPTVAAAYVTMAKLATDGGKQPLVEIEE